MTITLISVCLFIIYISSIIIKYGIPSSVSETFYLLPKNMRWLFTVFCWGVSIIVAPWLDITPKSWQFLAFLSVAGLCFVGTAAEFKEDLISKVHYTAAVVCMAASQLWIFLVTKLWYISLFCLLISAVSCYFIWRIASKKAGYKVSGNITFWAEMWAFISLFISLVIVQ